MEEKVLQILVFAYSYHALCWTDEAMEFVVFHHAHSPRWAGKWQKPTLWPCFELLEEPTMAQTTILVQSVVVFLIICGQAPVKSCVVTWYTKRLCTQRQTYIYVGLYCAMRGLYRAPVNLCTIWSPVVYAPLLGKWISCNKPSRVIGFSYNRDPHYTSHTGCHTNVIQLQGGERQGCVLPQVPTQT